MNNEVVSDRQTWIEFCHKWLNYVQIGFVLLRCWFDQIDFKPNMRSVHCDFVHIKTLMEVWEVCGHAN